jgi:hypothetical protein
MIAGPGVPLDEALVTQNCLYAEADGAGKAKVAVLRGWYKRFYSVAINEHNDAVAEKKIREMYAGLTEREKQMLDWSEAKLNDEIKDVLSPWKRCLLAFDPREYLTKVTCPVLALNGQKDLQVDPGQNLGGIAEVLKAGGNRDYAVTELPNLNHMLQTAETGAESEYAQIKETIAPMALEAIAGWILERVGKPADGR